jgi:uncharacterized protein (DUF885 family)
MRITRVAVASCAAAAFALTGAAAASASTQPPPSSVTVTLSPEQVQFLCEKRLPRAENRASKAIERINGGEDVRGSVANLKKRAEQERAAGRETSAQLLEERAERRAGRIDQLNKIKSWAADFRSKYCGGSK